MARLQLFYNKKHGDEAGPWVVRNGQELIKAYQVNLVGIGKVWTKSEEGNLYVVEFDGHIVQTDPALVIIQGAAL